MKEALVVISFGTSVPEARAGITAVEEALAQAVPAGTLVRRAFTSGMIRRILAERGETVPGPAEVLEELKAEGAERIVIQPTHLLCGCEYDKLKAEAEAFGPLAVGRPLLACNDDILALARGLDRQYPAAEGEAVVCMGHGTPHFANAAYPALQTALRLLGREDILIATVEGWPELEDVLGQLAPARRVTLVPLMLVAGDHARNDMAVDWKEQLEAAGHTVRCVFTGLGELEWVREMYRARLLEIW